MVAAAGDGEPLAYANNSAAGRAVVPAVSPDDNGMADRTRIFLRPIATPLPVAFLALGVVTALFGVLQLGWLPPSQGHVAGLTAVALAAPLQIGASVLGFLARDPVAGTGVALQGATWLLIGLTTLQSPPGSTSPGLGVLLFAAAVALLVPAVAGKAKLVAALVMATTGVRFGLTGWYEYTGSGAGKTAAGVAGLVLAVFAFYAALALELEGARRHTVLPVGRSGLAAQAVRGEEVFDPHELSREPGVRPRL